MTEVFEFLKAIGWSRAQTGLLTYQECATCSWIDATLESKRKVIRSNLNRNTVPFCPVLGYATKMQEKSTIENATNNTLPNTKEEWTEVQNKIK